MDEQRPHHRWRRRLGWCLFAVICLLAMAWVASEFVGLKFWVHSEGPGVEYISWEVESGVLYVSWETDGRIPFNSCDWDASAVSEELVDPVFTIVFRSIPILDASDYAVIPLWLVLLPIGLATWALLRGERRRNLNGVWERVLRWGGVVTVAFVGVLMIAGRTWSFTYGDGFTFVRFADGLVQFSRKVPRLDWGEVPWPVEWDVVPCTGSLYWRQFNIEVGRPEELYELDIAFPLWWIGAVAAVLTGLAWRRWRHRSPPGDWLCDRCGYNLRGNLSGICSECGARVPNAPAGVNSSLIDRVDVALVDRTQNSE